MMIKFFFFNVQRYVSHLNLETCLLGRIPESNVIRFLPCMWDIVSTIICAIVLLFVQANENAPNLDTGSFLHLISQTFHSHSKRFLSFVSERQNIVRYCKFIPFRIFEAFYSAQGHSRTLSAYYISTLVICGLCNSGVV